MSRRILANLFVSTVVALAALMIIVGVVGAKTSVALHTEPPTISSISTRATTSTLALPQVITTLHPFLGITPSPLPIRIGIDPYSGYIYIVCEQNNGVLVLRGTQVVGMIDRGTGIVVPISGQHGIAVNPVNGYTYIGNYFRGELSILSGLQPITTIQNMVGDYFIAANPVNGYVYATNSNGDIAVLSDTETITTIPSVPASFGDPKFNSDTSSQAPKSRSLQPLFPRPWPPFGGISIDSNTGLVYVARQGGCLPCPPTNLSGTISLISDTHMITVVQLAEAPIALDVNPTNGYVYILEWDMDANLSDYELIHVLSGTQVITVTGSERPWGQPQDGNVRVNPATGYVYVTRHNYPFENSDLTILSGTQVITRLALSIGPIGINPASGYVYLGSKFSDTVTVMSGTEIIGTLSVGLVPSDIQADPRTGLVYVTNYYSQSLSIIRERIKPVSSPSGLLSPADDITLDFNTPVITSTIEVEISPTLPHTLTWSAASDRTVISHDPFESGARYTVHVQPGGQATSGLPVIEKKFTYMYLPIHLFLPLFEGE